VMRRAREEFPEAQSVEMTIRAGTFPGERSRERFKVLAEAPGWEVTSWYP
jgi:hypothetical protein